ncbi:MAG: putative porin [Pseudomonadota bacterium]
MKLCCMVLAGALLAAPILLCAGEFELLTEGRLRAERTENLPDGRDFDRLRLHAFLGTRWFSDDGNVELGAAVKLSQGTDSERDNVRNLDNESSDDFEIGELYLRSAFGDHWLGEAGRTRLPFRLTPMVWDRDFRPAGASLAFDRELRTFDRLSLTLGYLAPLHIDESDSRLAGAQFGYRWREGAPTETSASLSYLVFDDLEELTREGRARTNSRGPDGLLLFDYTLLDLIIEQRLSVMNRPLALAVNVTKNLDPSDENEAARFSARFGDARDAGAWEFGYAYQRVQRDAVMAAFNEDDWWFPTRMRGFRLWAAYGITDWLTLEAAYFRERRDDLDDHVERLFVDLTWAW